MAGDDLQYTSRPLMDWIRRVHEGRIALPTFQRSSVWDISKVRSLIDSLLRNRPIGTLLLMPTDESRFRWRPIQGAEAVRPATGDGELILDGQQRLTALWRAFRGDLEPLFVRVKDWNANPLEVDAVGVAADLGFHAEHRLVKDEGERAVLHFQRNCVPLAVLGIDLVTQTEHALWRWCNQTQRNDGEKAWRLVNRIQGDIAMLLWHRRLWHLTLPREISQQEAIEIYIRTNESSAVIRRFDIAVAIYDSNTGESLRDEIVGMVEEMGAEKSLFESFFDTEEGEDRYIPTLGEVLFKVSCLWCGFAPTEGKYTEKAVLETLRQRKNELRDALLWALEFYQAEGVRDRRFVPSDVPLRVLPALFPTVRGLLRTDEAKVRRYVRSYLWRAFLTERYSRNANTRLHDDCRTMVANLKQGRSETTDKWREGVPIFSNLHYPLPDSQRLEDLDEDPLPSPRARNSLSRAVFAISLREGLDFATGQRAGSGLDQRWDYHHLFPKAYLKKSGMDPKQINHGLNQALVTGKTNSIIGRKPPHEYLAVDGDLARAANGETGKELPRLVESHRIPYAALVAEPRTGAPNDVANLYRKFIKARAKMVETAMKALIVGKATLTDD